MSGYCEECGNTICICDEATNSFNPDWLFPCTCGDRTAFGVVHMKDEPCYRPVELDRVYLTSEEMRQTIEALEEAVYLLNPTEGDMQEKAGIYRIVTALEMLKEKNT